MTFGKAAALTTGFVGAFALGVLAGPYMTDRIEIYPDKSAAVERQEFPADDATKSGVPAPRARAKVARPAAERAEASAPSAPAAAAATMPSSSPELQGRLKKVLRPGAKMDVASEGFKSAEQFATVAHAAQNTDLPFMVLKHRVVEEGKSVEAAIKESKPDADASAEASRARQQAREDLAAVESTGAN